MLPTLNEMRTAGEGCRAIEIRSSRTKAVQVTNTQHIGLERSRTSFPYTNKTLLTTRDSTPKRKIKNKLEDLGDDDKDHTER